MIEVFKDVEDEDFIELLVPELSGNGGKAELEIGLVVIAHRGGVNGGFQGVDAGDFITVVAEMLGEECLTAADIE